MKKPSNTTRIPTGRRIATAAKTSPELHSNKIPRPSVPPLSARGDITKSMKEAIKSSIRAVNKDMGRTSTLRAYNTVVPEKPRNSKVPTLKRSHVGRKTGGVPRLEKTQIIDLNGTGSEAEENEEVFARTYVDISPEITAKPKATFGVTRRITQSPAASNKTIKGENMAVAIRIRPFTDLEKKDARNKKPTWEVSKNGIYNWTRKKTHNFEHVFDSIIDTTTVFDSFLEPLILSALDNSHSLNITCYGQSGTGKAHTLFGSEKEPGIVQLVLETLFAFVEATPEKEFLIRAGFFEIYNESINDLSSIDKKNLQLLENSVKGLTEVACTKVSHGLELLWKGEKTKYHNVTSKSEKKNRSHSIYRIVMESKERNQETAPVNISVINLVKLSGAEYLSGEYKDEPVGYPHKSLHCLNLAIQKLTSNDSKRKSGLVSYKESKLTRYLQKSLEGNAKMATICTISPAYTSYEESMNTLSFAMRAKGVTLWPEKNYASTPSESLLLQYQRQLNPLKGQFQESHDSKTNRGSRGMILIAGEVDLTEASTKESAEDFSVAESLQDMTEEMEKKLQKSAGIEKRLKRIHDSRESSASPVLSTMKKAEVQGRKGRKGEPIIKTHDLALPAHLELEEPAEKPKDKELKDILLSSEKKFFDEIIGDYIQQMKDMQQEVKVLEIVKKSLLSENEKLLEELKTKDKELENAYALLEVYRRKYGDF